MRNLLKKVFDKLPILKYVLTSLLKWLIIAISALAVVFAVMQITNVYGKIETMLDLKYNSPFVLVPLFSSAALAVLCFVVGFLLYFHKYKRAKSRTRFNKSFENILERTQAKGNQRKGDRKRGTIT